ncbi:MAG TPA: hypothetical protein VGK22_16425 [Candidatus Angelobacter sp.]|jgi:hypothetical protein
MSALNLLVFRGDQRHIHGQELKSALVSRLEQLSSAYSADADPDALTRALLLAGELECGLADADSPSWRSAGLLTDRIADALVGAEPVSDFKSLIIAARATPVPEHLNISIPEGFAYYALHPLAYAEVLHKISVPANYLAVVGIRSIGTTLSAVTAAEARLRGMEVRRFTVRPQGHPYNRQTELALSQFALVQNAGFYSATFAIVDEGPGLSGSSFLSVAEALEQAGVPSEKIVFLSSHAPNVETLCASDAAQRWKRFHCVAAAAEPQRPHEASEFIGGGHWRSRLLANEPEWPAAWTSFERLKYLSAPEQTNRRLFKFAGLGHHGDQVFERELKIAEAGFGPTPKRESDGYISCPWIAGMDGRPMTASDISENVLARVAEYCAFRAEAFAAESPDFNALQQMAEHNLRELKLDVPVELKLERPGIVDGNMQPHEWLLTKEGRMLKTDSGSHGDDHFFPGPTDIAWDLAGAIVEWRMDDQQAKELLDLYRRASGDDASARIDGFIKAYAVFRAAYCVMAANAMNGSDEQQRLERAAADYHAILTKNMLRNVWAA